MSVKSPAAIANAVSSGVLEVVPERLQVFSIYDGAAQAYMPPFFMPTIGMAIRAFGDDVANPQSHFSRHPADYVLYHFGSFNDLKGIFTLFAPEDRKIISRALDHVTPVNKAIGELERSRS